MFTSGFNLLKILKTKLLELSTREDLDEIKILFTQTLVSQNKKEVFDTIQDAEFKVFSQWGEDGIIQYLVNKLPINNKVFIEFGVENYTEANTRFLLENDNWSGLILDGSKENIESIKRRDIYWKYDLLAKEVFITKDNINAIIDEYIKSNKYNKEIGLLSIDIDGNDYYIWESINSIDPIIVICEYNWIFGNKLSLSVPYDELFVRTDKHYSNLFFGASIRAICSLAEKKGYEYIGCTKAGNDAFFIKKEYATKYLSELITSPSIVFNEQKAKESRDKNGNLTFVRGKERVSIIKDCSVIDLETNELVLLDLLIKEGKL